MNILNTIKKFIKDYFPKPSEEKWESGLVPSPEDFRDVKMGEVVKQFNPLPEEFKIPYILTMKNQGSTPQCVAYSTTTCKENKERGEDNFIDFDPNWLYNECKKSDGIPDVRGTYIRQALKVGKNIGFKSLDNQDDPAKYKIAGYVKIEPLTIENLKQAIVRFGVVIGAFYVYADNSWGSAYLKKTSNQILGAHAVALIGWDKTHIIGQNSYSKNWGDKGYFYFDKDFMPYECWAIVLDMPNDLLPDLNSKPKYHFSKELFFGADDEQDVKALQDCLRYLGCLPKTQESTGTFGAITLNGVKIFQQRYGISPTGYVGPITIKKMNELFN